MKEKWSFFVNGIVHAFDMPYGPLPPLSRVLMADFTLE
jgi:hypothetical protein